MIDSSRPTPEDVRGPVQPLSSDPRAREEFIGRKLVDIRKGLVGVELVFENNAVMIFPSSN